MKIYERDKKIGFTRTYTVNPDMVISEPVQCGVCDTEHPNGKLLAFCVNRAGGGGLIISTGYDNLAYSINDGVECTMETESMLLHFRNLMVNQQTEDTLEVL
jgi:hypothetical protein